MIYFNTNILSISIYRNNRKKKKKKMYHADIELDQIIPSIQYDISFKKYLFKQWIDWIVIILCLIGFALEQNVMKTIVFDGWNTRPMFQFPFKPDTVSSLAVFLAWFILWPFFTCLFVQLIYRYYFIKRWNLFLDIYHFFIGLLQCGALLGLIISFIKKYVSFPRPSAVARFNRNINTYSTSFPSGHTAFSFGGMTYSSLYLSGKIGIFRKKGMIFRQTDNFPYRNSFTIGFFAIIVPFSFAMWIGATRIIDYAHHPSDVVAGMILGSFIAIFSYFLNFPSLCDTRCFLPKAFVLN